MAAGSLAPATGFGTARPTDIRFEYLREELRFAHVWSKTERLVFNNLNDLKKKSAAILNWIAGLL